MFPRRLDVSSPRVWKVSNHNMQVEAITIFIERRVVLVGVLIGLDCYKDTVIDQIRLLSTGGTQDGLVWEGKQGQVVTFVNGNKTVRIDFDIQMEAGIDDPVTLVLKYKP
jgi:hypothetical protein